jgi:cellulose synthase/poly-beta-1,6-N-acetylglucosamine synthase-like glycosyltransferase
MIQIFEIAVLIPSVAVLLLASFLGAEVIGAFLPQRKRDGADGEPGPIAIVIPAHNEAASICGTLSSIQSQARPGDRVIVVADNCTDKTASVATSAGAQCWERTDPGHRGKGYALQFALDRLKKTPPETVIFVDADCTLADGGLIKLSSIAEREGRPVQALYLMKAPEGAGPRLRVSEFAWVFLNHVRMRGLDRLFGVSRFTGAGMALPWRLAERLDVGSGEIVEDLALTLDLTERRAAPILLLDVVVESEFPTTEEALAKQRARWEHGSQQLAARRALPSLVKAIASGNIKFFAIAFDLLIPPIMNLVGLIALVVAAGLVVAIAGALTPLIVSLTAMLIVSVSIAAAWVKFGKEALPLSSLSGLAPFLAAKRNIYNAEGRTSAKSWTPTRNGDADSNAGD